MAQSGVLYLIATPIGNLRDLSLRALDTLASVDLVACEDTRVTGRLLRRLSIQAELISCRDENEESLAPKLLERLLAGQSIALVSDAGTPAISDPGFRIVRACRAASLPVVPVPGPAAAIAALCASGLPSDCFYFAGFLPPKRSARKKFLRENRESQATQVLYESPHRVGKFLAEIIEELGPTRLVAVARELTKRHETFHVGPAEAVAERVAAGSQKGEFVVCIAKSGFNL